MDNNEMQNAVEHQAENAQHAVETFQAQAKQAGEDNFAAAKDAARDMGDKVRVLMEKSLHETRVRYAKTKTAMDEASSAFEASLGAARDGVSHINVKAMDALKADAEANFALVTSLVSAKSISDMITLNTEFVRKRFEDATARAKSFSEMARKVAEDSASPIREQVSKSVKFAS